MLGVSRSAAGEEQRGGSDAATTPPTRYSEFMRFSHPGTLVLTEAALYLERGILAWDRGLEMVRTFGDA